MSERISILELLDRLEATIDDGGRIPFSGKSMVSREKALDLLDRIRAELPQEYRTAKEVLDKREAILRDARNKADEALRDARQRAEKLVSESEVARLAKHERDRLIEETMRGARQTRQQANEYAAAVMKSLANSLKGVMDQVERSRDRLIEGLKPVSPEEDKPGEEVAESGDVRKEDV